MQRVSIGTSKNNGALVSTIRLVSFTVKTSSEFWLMNTVAVEFKLLLNSAAASASVLLKAANWPSNFQTAAGNLAALSQDQFVANCQTFSIQNRILLFTIAEDSD
jgi:hypothetical protein